MFPCETLSTDILLSWRVNQTQRQGGSESVPGSPHVVFASNFPSSQKALVPTVLTGWQDLLFILDTQGLMTFLSSKSFLPLFM